MKMKQIEKIVRQVVKESIMGSEYAKNLGKKADKLSKGGAERNEVEGALLESTRNSSSTRKDEVETFVKTTRRSGWQNPILKEEVTRILQKFQETEDDSVLLAGAVKLLPEMSTMGAGAVSGPVMGTAVLEEEDDGEECDEAEKDEKMKDVVAEMAAGQPVTDQAVQIIAKEMGKARTAIKKENKRNARKATKKAKK